MREQERVLIRKWSNSPVDLILAAMARIYPLGRVVARTLGLQSSRHPRLSVLLSAMLDPWASPEAFDRDYANVPDHWGYTTEPRERERHLLALQLLDFARDGKRFAVSSRSHVPKASSPRCWPRCAIPCSQWTFLKLLWSAHASALSMSIASASNYGIFAAIPFPEFSI